MEKISEKSNTAKMKFRNMSNLIRFIVSFGAIGAIVYLFRDHLPAVAANLTAMIPLYFFISLALFFIGLIFIAVRLRLVLGVHDVKLSLRESYYMNLIALFFNNVLPSSLGGEAVKAYYIYKQSNGKKESFGGVIVDRLIGLITLVLIGVFAILLFEQGLESPKIIYSVIIMCVITITITLLFFNDLIMKIVCSVHVPLLPVHFVDKLKEVYTAMHFYRKHKKLLAGAIALSIMAQCFFVFTYFLLAKSLAIDIPVIFFAFFVPVIAILTLAPSINGVGVREATYLFYVTEFTTADKALALSLLTTFEIILIGIIGGIFYAFCGGLSSKA